MKGKVAGLTIFSQSGNPGAPSYIRIRGNGSILGNNTPLFVVDGIPYENYTIGANPRFPGFDMLSFINTLDVESIHVLKNAKDVAPYGVKGSNGVIVITTKRGKDRSDGLSVEFKSGTNYQGIDRYEVIRSPEEYIGISWEAAYQRGMLQTDATNASAVTYANDNLFESATNDDFSDISQVYNMWNVSDVSELIDPATATVRPGVTRRYNPENWEDYSLQSASRNEALLTFSDSKLTY